MIIHVGSKNPTKLAGVRNVLATSSMFETAEIVAVDAKVPEFDHPKTLEATIVGAKARARTVFEGSDYSIGIESGLFPSTDAASGFFETTVCALFDGERYYLGLGPSFEWPTKMVELILEGQDGSQAFKSLGLTDHQKIGTANGAIYTLTKQKINRTELNELAVMMALMQVENPTLYTV